MTYSSTSQPDILFIFLILYITFHLFSLFPACSWFWFLFVWGFVLFLFAQALCEVNEMLTRTWYFPTCFPTPSSPPPLFFFSSTIRLGFSGMGCSGWEEGMAIFHLQLLCKCQVFCRSTKNASLAGCFKEKNKKKIKQKCNLISGSRPWREEGKCTPVATPV